MKDLYICEKNDIKPFSPHVVYSKKRKNTYHLQYVIDFYDDITNNIVLSIGTSDIDDYYPCFIDHFNNKSLAINKEPKKYKEYIRIEKLKRILDE